MTKNHEEESAAENTGIAAFAIRNAHVTVVMCLAATLLGGLALVLLPLKTFSLRQTSRQ